MLTITTSTRPFIKVPLPFKNSPSTNTVWILKYVEQIGELENKEIIEREDLANNQRLGAWLVSLIQLNAEKQNNCR